MFRTKLWRALFAIVLGGLVSSAAGCGGQAGDGSCPFVTLEGSAGSWEHISRPSGSSGAT